MGARSVRLAAREPDIPSSADRMGYHEVEVKRTGVWGLRRGVARLRPRFMHGPSSPNGLLWGDVCDVVGVSLLLGVAVRVVAYCRWSAAAFGEGQGEAAWWRLGILHRWRQQSSVALRAASAAHHSNLTS